MTVELPPAPLQPLAYAASGTPARPGILTTLGVASIAFGSVQLLLNGLVVSIAAVALYSSSRFPSRPSPYRTTGLELYCLDCGVCFLLALALIGCGVLTLATTRYARKANQAYAIGRFVVALLFMFLYWRVSHRAELMLWHLPGIAFACVLFVAMRAGSVRRYYESALAY